MMCALAASMEPKNHARQMRAMGDAACGAFEIGVIERGQLPALMDAVKAGNMTAAMTMRSINGWLNSAFSGVPPLCLTCDHEFSWPTEPAMFVVALAENAGSIVSGVCGQCARDHGPNGIQERAIKLLQKQPLGACYKMSAERLQKLGPGRDVVIVHGVVEWPTPNRRHAWLQWPDGRVWDNTAPDGFAGDGPSPGRMWSREEWEAQCEPTVQATYRLGEARQHFKKYGHWGPW